MYVLLNVVFVYVFINFVFGRVFVSLYLINSINAFGLRDLSAPPVENIFRLVSFLFSMTVNYVIFLSSFLLFLPSVKCVNGMHCFARLNMLYQHCPLTSGQCGYTSTYHDVCIVRLPKNGLHCYVCLSTTIIKKQ